MTMQRRGFPTNSNDAMVETPSGAIMTDYNQCKTTYDRDGFVVVKQFLTPQELAELQKNLDRYIREIVPTLPDSHAFYQERVRPESLKQMQFMEKVDSFFRDYVNHPKWN